MRVVTRGAVAVATALTLAAGVTACNRPTRPAEPSTLYITEAEQVHQDVPDTRPWFCNAAGNGTPLSGHGNGSHVNPLYAGQTKGPLTWDDCLALARQLDETLTAVKPFDTRGKGEAAGWKLGAEYIPGLGTHHSRNGVAAAFSPATFDHRSPTFLIYGGRGADAPLIGVAYTLQGNLTPPPAFAGTNDWWHLHAKVCADWASGQWPPPLLAGAGEVSDEECQRLGGINFTMPLGGQMELHLWLMPPYQYKLDIFSSGHNCQLADGIAPPDDPCWDIAHRDPALGMPTGAAPDHGGQDH